MSQRISFTVHGKVQGVFFRDFTQKQAGTYSVTGFAKNSSDGTVTGEAQGDEEALKKFKSALNKGPSRANVTKVEVKDIAVKDGEKSFDA